MLKKVTKIFNKYKYTDKEMEELISSMVILIDTREKANSHITDYFERKGIAYKKKALDYGDYSFMIPSNEKLGILRDLYFNATCIIERKASLEEISGNLTQGRDRFEKNYVFHQKQKYCSLKILLMKISQRGITILNIIGSLLWHQYIVFGLSIIFQLCLCRTISIRGCLLGNILNIF